MVNNYEIPKDVEFLPMAFSQVKITIHTNGLQILARSQMTYLFIFIINSYDRHNMSHILSSY